MFFILLYFSPQDQGYWYIFISFAIISIIIDFGFSIILTQEVGHVFARYLDHKKLPVEFYSQVKSLGIHFIKFYIILLIIIGGIQLTFRANKGNGGEDYVKRMVLLSLPIVVRLIVGFLIFGSLINVVLILVDCSVLITSLWMPIVISVLFQIIFFWRLTVHLRFITS